MKISVTHLGLAAYIKANGATLLEVREKTFIFDSDKSASAWRVQYNNSCCMKHDSLVCELRHHLRGD